MQLNRNLEITLSPGVYEPADDSFLLIEIMNVKKGQQMLDMGTGSGIVALHCAVAGCMVTAVDLNPDAVRCAKENALRNRLEITAVESDLFEKIRGRFDIIAFNPPYLPADGDGADDRAWTGGKTGHELFAKFLAGAKSHLADGGVVYGIATSIAFPGGKFEGLRDCGYSVEIISGRKSFFEELYGLRMKVMPTVEIPV